MEKQMDHFSGGVHPANGSDKALTAEKQIIEYIPKTINVSMKQGLGPACRCMVKAGDHVQQGQLIGESTHFLTSVLHAPVTGTVLSASEENCEIAVESCELPCSHGNYTKEWMDISEFTKETIVGKLEEGGLVGMGGAGFPTHVKYKTKDPITHLLVNASECEPYLTCDEHLMSEQGMAILNGIQLLKKAAGAKQAIICMEDNKSHCKQSLEDLLKDHDPEITVQLFPTKYPQGGERQLIKASMGVEVPAGGLPASVGAIVSNVHTAKAAADMVFGNMPSVSRVITITGDVKEPGNYLVPLGTDIGELVKAAGDVKNTQNKVILGGPMTGRCIGENMNAEMISSKAKVTVTKVSGGLVVLEGYHPVESNCIRCGGCANVCPAGLVPFKIDMAYRKNRLDLCRALDATECIACGCCSYICPAKRELTFHTVAARDAVRAKMREEANRG